MEDVDDLHVHIQSEEGINYLTVNGVLGLYAQVVGCPPGEVGSYVRSKPNLESAVMHPWNVATYEEDADIPLQAAYLAHGIAEGQAFIDGNKEDPR